MKDFKGTKGQWKLSRRSSTAVECEGRVICSTGGYSDNSRSEEVWIENDYNAKLIATAPELLESLSELLEAISNLKYEYLEGFADSVDKAEKAVNKALVK